MSYIKVKIIDSNVVNTPEKGHVYFGYDTGGLWIKTDDGSVIPYTSGGTSGGGSDFSAIDSDLIPSVDITYNLGSPTKKWKDLYLSGSSIHLGNDVISTNGTNLLFGNKFIPNIVGEPYDNNVLVYSDSQKAWIPSGASFGTSGIGPQGPQGESGTNGTSGLSDPGPIIKAISTTNEGYVGESRIIKGYNFVDSGSTLTFGSTLVPRASYDIDRLSNPYYELITTKIISNDVGSMILKFSNSYGSGQIPFTVLASGGTAPTITGFYEAGGGVDVPIYTPIPITTGVSWQDWIRITGTDFLASGTDPIVYFGDTMAWMQSGITDTSMYARVQNHTPTQTLTVKVTNGNGTGSKYPLNIFSGLVGGPPPTITQVIPNVGITTGLDPGVNVLIRTGQTTSFQVFGTNFLTFGKDATKPPDYQYTGITTAAIGSPGLSTGYVSSTELNCTPHHPMPLGLQTFFVYTDFGSGSYPIEVCKTPTLGPIITSIKDLSGNTITSGQTGDDIVICGYNLDKWHGTGAWIGSGLTITKLAYIYPVLNSYVTEASFSGTTSIYNSGWTKLVCTIPDLPYSGVVDIAVHTAISATGPKTYNGNYVYTGFELTSASANRAGQQLGTAIAESKAESNAYTDQKSGATLAAAQYLPPLLPDGKGGYVTLKIGLDGIILTGGTYEAPIG